MTIVWAKVNRHSERTREDALRKILRRHGISEVELIQGMVTDGDLRYSWIRRGTARASVLVDSLIERHIRDLMEQDD